MVNSPAITPTQQNFGELLFLLRLLFGFNYAGVTLWITCIAGTIYSLEEIAMTLILPV
ncbi:MAG: hypothetical protein RMZ69_18545 [Nostoc sp. ChiQUE01a]|nr:hypothetical protein [Nostoc sp. ChiQUE01a]